MTIVVSCINCQKIINDRNGLTMIDEGKSFWELMQDTTMIILTSKSHFVQTVAYPFLARIPRYLIKMLADRKIMRFLSEGRLNTPIKLSCAGQHWTS